MLKKWRNNWKRRKKIKRNEQILKAAGITSEEISGLINSKRENTRKLFKFSILDNNNYFEERNDLFEMETIIQQKTNKIKKLNQNLSELVSKIDEMHKENLNIGNEYTIFKIQINDLYDEYISIYNNYYHNNQYQNQLNKIFELKYHYIHIIELQIYF